MRRLLKQPSSKTSKSEDEMLDIFGSQSGKEASIIWISGEPGMGKTWLVHNWRSRLAQNRLNGRGVGRVPIFLSLGDLSNRLLTPGEKFPGTLAQAIPNLPDYIKDSICNVLNLCLKKGDSVVFLDGRDEITSPTERSLAEWIAQQQKDYPLIQFVITTRPAVNWWQRDVAATHEVLPLDDVQIDNFIKSWFGGAMYKRADKVKRALKTRPGLNKIARNPMISTMLCMSWEKYGEMQTGTPKITEFYEQGARLLLEEWDHFEHAKLHRAAPELHSVRRASVEEKLDVLAHVAEATFLRNEIVSDALRSIISQLLPNNIASDDVIQDIEMNGALLRRSDSGLPNPKIHWEFSHLTFAEYFAARVDATTSNQPPAKLAAHFRDPQWENRIAMVIEMRPEWRTSLANAALKYLPEDIGRIAKVSSATAEKQFVVLVDMCVDNWSGRMNIVRMLRPLIATDITTLITTSGAEGYVDTALFKAFSDEEIRREVALHFVKKLEITGVEYLSIGTDLEFYIWGTEDRELYGRQLKLFAEGNRWCEEYQGLYAKRAEFAVKELIKQMKHRHVELTALTAEPLLLWEVEKELERNSIAYATVYPHEDKNVGEFSRYISVMRNEKTPFEELLAGE